MRPDLFPSILLGHMVGDYLLQNNWMAMNKGGSTLKCAVHCLIYTWAVDIFTYPFFHHDWRWLALVFLSYFPIDRWSLADKWLRHIGGRSMTRFMADGHKNIPAEAEGEASEYRNYHALRAGFTSLVYAAADNTMHLVILYYSALLLLGSNS